MATSAHQRGRRLDVGCCTCKPAAAAAGFDYPATRCLHLGIGKL